MKVCYFTATGNCLYAGKRIGGEAFSIQQMMKQDKIALTGNAVGILCPVYGGEMPKMVRRFMEKVTIKADYFFFIYTYGMNNSVAIPNAASLAAKTGGQAELRERRQERIQVDVWANESAHRSASGGRLVSHMVVV